ncbi:putative ribonuclease H-like domain-containing protein [Tanacetum coccineum]
MSPTDLSINAFRTKNDDEDVDAEADLNNLDAFMPVWTLVDLSNGKRAIGTKWVYWNKKDERGIVIKNKARLVAQGYTQEEGIDYDEVFAPIARIEAIRLFLAYASFKDFMVYQMDVKSTFLYGKIEEEVYFCQPLGFEEPDFPDRVYKVEKALYGLHQAPRACQDKYMTEILKKFCFTDVKTASTPMKTQKPLLKDEDAYIDSDYAGASLDRKSTIGGCQFLGCRLISGQCKKQIVVANSTTEAEYVAASINAGDSKLMLLGINLLLLGKVNAARHKLTAAGEMDGKNIIVTEASIRRDLQLNDEEGTDCLPNATIFEELTRMGYEKLSQKLTFYKAFFSPQWKFLIHTILQCLSAKTTAWNEFSSTMASAIICLATNQKFNFSKYIFESMVKNLDNAGKFLMYPRFVQVFLDKQLEGMSSHKRIYVTPSHTKKIFGNMKRVGKGFSRRETPLFPTMMVQAQEEIGEGSVNPTDPHHTPTIIQPSTSQAQKKQKPRKPKRKDTEVPQPSGPTDNVAEEAVYEEMDDSLERVATTATSLDQRRIGVVVPGAKKPWGILLLKLGLIMYLNSPMIHTLKGNSTSKVADEITRLKRRVKRLEKKGGSKTYGLKRLYKVGSSRRVESYEDEGLGEEDASKQRRIADIDADAGINLVSTHFDADTDMFRVHDLVGDEVIVETEVASKGVNLSVVEVTLAQALAALKSAKPKADKVMLQEPEQGTITTTTATTTVTAASTRPKAKGLVIHEQEQAPTPTVSSQQPS